MCSDKFNIFKLIVPLGIIKQQTIKGTIYSYVGAVIGFVSLVVLSPRIFSSEQIGLTQVMVAISTIIAQLGGLGFSNVTNRLFPYFRTGDKRHNGYLSLGMLVTVAGFIITLVILWLYIPHFIDSNSEKSKMLLDYDFLIPGLIGLMMLFNLLDNFCKVLFNAAIGTLMREVVLRLVNLLLILIYFAGYVDFDMFVWLYVASFGVPVVAIAIYLATKGELRFGSFREIWKPDFVKQMVNLCLFGIIAGLSGIALTNVDKYMVNYFEGLGSAGVYSIAVYFATLILIPARSLGKISVPVIAEAWKREDFKEIQWVYYGSSINQYIVGLLLLLGIICNMENIFQILPPEYRDGEIVIVLFGIANLIKVLSGVGTYILGTSPLYRYQTYLMILLVGLIIGLSLVLIPPMGLKGAALASLISVFVTTALTVLILRWQYRIWPLGKKHLLLTLAGIIVYFLVLLLPQMSLVYDIIIRSGLITVVFILLVRLFRISDEATALFDRGMRYLKRS